LVKSKPCIPLSISKRFVLSTIKVSNTTTEYKIIIQNTKTSLDNMPIYYALIKYFNHGGILVLI
jgi:hypothetical protein